MAEDRHAHSRKATLFTFRPCEPFSRPVQGSRTGRLAAPIRHESRFALAPYPSQIDPEYSGVRRADRASETHAQTQLPASIEYLAACLAVRGRRGCVRTRSRVSNQNPRSSFKPEPALGF